MATWGATLKVEAAFGDNAFVASPTWTDISSYARSVQIKRGRQQTRSKFTAGTCTVALRNEDRRFDPEHTTGAYYPDVKVNVRIRVTLTYSATDYIQFVGFADSWQQRFTPGDQYGECVLKCTDGFKLLTQVELPESVYEHEVREDGPKGWWPLGDLAPSTVAVDWSTNGYHGTIRPQTTQGLGSLIAGSEGASMEFFYLRDDNGLSQTADSGVIFNRALDSNLRSTVGPFSFECWYLHGQSTKTGNGGIIYMQPPSDANGGSNDHFYIQHSRTYPSGSDVPSIANRWNSSKLYVHNPDSTDDETWGDPHHLVYTISAGGAQTLYRDGSTVALSTAGEVASSTDFDQSATFIGGGAGMGVSLLAFSHSRLQHISIWDKVLTSTQVTDHWNGGNAPWNDDATGTRIGRILDLVGWPSADRDLDTGDSLLGHAFLGRKNALGYMQLVEATEQGRLFVARDGKVTFHSRTSRVVDSRQNTTQVTLTDDGGADGAYKTQGFVFEYDERRIVNEARISNHLGATVEAKSTGSIDTYGPSRQTVQTLAEDPEEMADMAQFLVDKEDTPSLYVSSVTVEPDKAAATMYPKMLALEIGDKVKIERTPQGVGSQIAKDVTVEGVEWTIDPNTPIRCKMWLSPYHDQDYWVWEESQWGSPASSAPAVWGV